MKNIKLFTCAVAALLLGAQSVGAASWKGNDPSDVAGKSGDAGTVYLYNVGTGLFIEAGGYWGTEAVTGETGSAFTLSSSDNYYVFTSTVTAEGATTNGVLAQCVSTNVQFDNDARRLYTDRQAGASQTTEYFTLTEVNDGDNDTKVYSLKVGGYYYTATDKHLSLTASTADNSATDTNAQWMLVTLADRKAYFKNTEAANATSASPADGTYAIYDQNFNRKNNDVTYWKTGSDQSGELAYDISANYLPEDHACGTATTATYTYTGTCTHTYTPIASVKREYTLHGNHTDTPTYGEETTYSHIITRSSAEDYGDSYTTTCGGASYTYSYNWTNSNFPYNSGTLEETVTFESQEVTLTKTDTKTETTSWDATTYYVGNGYKDGASDGELHEADKTDDGYDSNYTITMQYGDYWTANIHGAGVISQNFTVTTAGWYQVSCDGFTTAEDVAKLFAKTGGKGSDGKGLNASAEQLLTYLSGEDVPATYVKAGKLLQTEGYEATVMVYANYGDVITFGVEATATECEAWACLDNFQLKYCGDQTTYLVLSELKTSMDYINMQVDATKSYPMVLERELKANQWNSLILPVSMTAQQVKAAFGGGVKLSKIDGIDTNVNQWVLNFKAVDLSKDENEGIVAGTLYIIKPATAPGHAAGDKYDIWDRVDSKISEKDYETQKPYYLINQMALTAAPAQTNGVVKQENVPGNSITGDLTFKGTYIKQESEETVPVHSFLLSAKSGKWYFTQNKSYAVKGFRAWIETSVDNTQTAKSVAFYNDGELVNEVDLSGAVTAIESLGLGEAKVSGDVYGVNGQLVRKGASSLVGLPKGVYIVNNKKYIVK